MVTTKVTIPGYQVSEELYNGSRTLVYRGYRETDSLPVAIKLLKNPYPSFNELVQFRNQYTITKNLNSPLIVQTYSLEAYQNGYGLVMEDFGGISLHQWALNGEKAPSLQELLEIAITISNALEILYRERIIHKDIKPSNLLINPETKEVKIIDFSIASLLPKETQILTNPNVLEGTLAYISPEQTGRMNRGIDYRTDFYSLGITFYELLTGELPFQSDDPMELVYCHIAKMPAALGNRHSRPGNSEEIPGVLSDIVFKLMAKNAEDRYQSALGLKYDLEKCLTQLRENGQIEYFEIGQRDVSDRFIIPDKLYGRETEVETLLQAFERVSNSPTPEETIPPKSPLGKGGEGRAEMILVAGFSGIGKTAVVNEVHKPIVEKRGYFIKGKYDQFNRNIPFSAFVQAFRDLMGQLLSESDEELANWKSKLLEAVGENGQVLVKVIPELERVIGSQPEATELSGTAAQNRFNLLFQKFIAVFTTPEHPLVLFLDDLQWADSASLNLMKVLMSESENGRLLLLGSYRDNEVFPAHPLMLSLGELEKESAEISTITLAPLPVVEIASLVAETLNCTSELAQPLTELVYQKTRGNPFFTTQFLKGLYKDELIIFNADLGYWECDLVRVRDAALTDDVVEFMAGRLLKLPQATQDVLKLAACIGNQFDLETLAIVCENSIETVATELWGALREGLVLPITEAYKFFQSGVPEEQYSGDIVVGYRFLHDRVQQAAYSLIPDAQKQIIHYHTGQLLLNNISLEKQKENIFNIVNHLNKGRKLIATKKQSVQLAELNLLAGEKALSAIAYATAAQYCEMGIESLDSNSWQNQYRLTLSLYECAIKAEYLNINFSRSQALANFVLERTTNILDRVKLYEVQIQMYMAQSQMPKALAVGMLALELLEVDLDHAPASSAIHLPKLSVIESLPVMNDPHQIAVMRILMAIFSPAYTTRPELLSPIVLTMIDLSLRQGHTASSAFAYVFYGIFLCGFEKDLERGYYSGLLALKVLNRFSPKELECRINNLFNVFIRPWKEPLANSLEPLGKASQIGFEVGDIEYASYATAHRCTYYFLAGEVLKELQERQSIAMEVLQRIKQDHSLGNAQVWQQLVSNLLGEVSDPKQFLGNHFNETELLPIFCAGNDRSLPFTAYLAKCILNYLLGDYSVAVTSAVNAAKDADAAIGITLGIHNFYYSLALLSKFLNLSSLQESKTLSEITNDRSLLDQVKTNQKFLKVWAAHSPQNFEHKYNLVEAEKCRFLDKKIEAIELYDRAISGAKENEYIQEEALSNELVAKFYLDWGKEKIAAVYMQEAYYCYTRWGALAKVNQLETTYPKLLQPILQQQRFNLNPLETISFHRTLSSTRTNSTDSTSISNVLDFTSVLKAAQAISSSLELDPLIASLSRIIIENSGAKKAALLLPQDDIWLLKAITSLECDEIQTILEPQSLENYQDLPAKIINYVKNTKQTVVIDNCQTDIPGLIEEYMLSHQPLSVLCTPIINQGKLLGILYLENQQVSGVFTSDRLSVIHLLSSQAAISLENARLYQQSQQALQDLQQAQLQLVQSEKMSALGSLVAGVGHEMNNPLGFIAASLELTKPTVTDIIEHLKLYQATFPNPSDEILNHAEEIDLDYSLEDVSKMLDSMTIACDRLKNISTSLRTFSRADREYKVPFNIHEGIDSTLLILKHRLKANEKRPAIKVITNYGNLPKIECFAGQLNQVFMNIISNAIDALYESNIGLDFEKIQMNPNQIIITTSVENQSVKIFIADNGQGMNESVKAKIFDHLFTTKGVGKGTGLGLAIAKSIVIEKHGGTIDVNSTVNAGTEFMITLPIQAPNQT